MKRFQQMIKTHDTDHIETVRQLQYTLDSISEGDIEAARSEIMEAYRAAKKTQAAFNELALLVGVLLNELQQVDQSIEGKAAPAVAPISSPTPVSDAEAMFVMLLKRLRIDEELPF